MQNGTHTSTYFIYNFSIFDYTYIHISNMSQCVCVFRRWARSTLVLVPLFGVHYAFFMGMSYSVGVNETVEIVWLFCDQLFASFQVCNTLLIIINSTSLLYTKRQTVLKPQVLLANLLMTAAS